MAYLNPGAGMPATTLHEALTEEPEVGDTYVHDILYMACRP